MQIHTSIAFATFAASAVRHIAAFIAGLAILAALAIPILLTAFVALPALMLAIPLVAIGAALADNPHDPIAPEPPRIADVVSLPTPVTGDSTRHSRAAA